MGTDTNGRVCVQHELCKKTNKFSFFLRPSRTIIRLIQAIVFTTPKTCFSSLLHTSINAIIPAKIIQPLRYLHSVYIWCSDGRFLHKLSLPAMLNDFTIFNKSPWTILLIFKNNIERCY